MKKIINGKKYNTETAKLVGAYDNGRSYSDFSYYREELYKKRTGEFFLYGEGGPMTKYAKLCGQNSWSGGEKITPLGINEAKEWAEKCLDGDEYEEIFGEVDELNNIVIKVDKVVYDFDPYGYGDNECSPEKAKELIINDPLQVIEMLADMLEEVLI